MMDFIYVFGKEHRDRMLNMGYRLLKHSESQDLYVFDNPDKMNFSLDLDIPHVLTNVLTF